MNKSQIMARINEKVSEKALYMATCADVEVDDIGRFLRNYMAEIYPLIYDALSEEEE